MSNLLTVQDPDENAAQQATDTRALLQTWADEHLPSTEPDLIQELSAGSISQYRQAGVSYLSGSKMALEGKGDAWKPMNAFSALLLQFAHATRGILQEFPYDSMQRELSHVMEGLTREFHKQFFQAGMKWNVHAEYLACLSIHTPHRTSGYQDRIWHYQTGTQDLNGMWHCAEMLAAPMSQDNWCPAWDKYQTAIAEKFAPIYDWMASQAQVSTTRAAQDKRYWLTNLTSIGGVVCAIHYMDHDGPWVAGFLNFEDLCRLRFRRIRLGAYLTENGLSDHVVRSRVEKAKQQVAGATFEAYPNDISWEDLYTSGPGSCMADATDEYKTWDDIHPVSAYASSYHGAGDNGLALLISRDDEGTIIGRGILNLQRGSIVRWYGDPVAERVLKRSGVTVSDRHCFEGSWLALLENSEGTRFIHPYVDGDIAYGVLEDGRVYIKNDGICIQETAGSSYHGDCHYCIDVDDEVDEVNCLYQAESDTYVSSNVDSWRCPIINEWDRDYSRVTLNIHGAEVEVHSHVGHNPGRYMSREDGYIYTIDDDETREEFFRYHGIEEEETEDED